MTLAYCISYAIYVRVLFIIKIVLSFTIEILLKNACPNATIGLFLYCCYLWSILSLGALIKLFLFSSTPLCLVHEIIKSPTKSPLRLWKQ